ncbi:MAG: hypothetical protein ACRCY5_04745 [Phocaeicola sp.]
MNNKLTYSIITLLLSLSIVSCNDEQNVVEGSYVLTSLPISRSIIQLEECSIGILRSGTQVALPWTNSVKTTIDVETRKDVCQSDGWSILYSNIDIVGYDELCTKADHGVNYLLLYNKYSGVLKGFYYAESIAMNNMGLWQISTERPTRIFNFTTEFAKAINDTSSPQSITTSTISSNGITQGFEFGWNCFSVELSYEFGSSSNKLNIAPYALNKAQFEFSGIYNANSSGTIINTSQNKSTIIEGIISGSGEAGKNWIKDQIGDNKPIKYASSVIQEVASRGIAGIVSNGLYRVFGSVLGKTRTTTDIQFQTNGKIKLEGEMVSAGSGIISPLSGIPLNQLGYDLGVWNLEETPIYESTSAAPLVKIVDTNNGSNYYYTLNFTPKYNLITNPTISSRISKWSSIVRYDKHNGTIPRFYDNYISQGYSTEAFRINSLPELYNDSLQNIKHVYNYYYYDVCARNVLPNKTDTSNRPSLAFADSKVNIPRKCSL